MAGSALMLILGCLIAIAVIVFLSNAAPSKGVEAAAAASTTAEAATSDTGDVVTSGGAGAGASAGADASGADMGAPAAQNYAAPSSSNKDTLRSGETLAEGESLTSKNGKYVLTYEYGTATMKSGNFTMWSSSGRPSTGGVMKITDDGNLGIFPSQYSVTPSGWASGTAGQGTKPYSLIVRDAGQLMMLDSTPTVIWTAPVTMPPVGVDCVTGDWGEWSACSKNCGGGTQTRNRAAITQPNAGGKACDNLVETRPCNTEPCPDCAFSWAPFGQCVTKDPATGAGKKQSQLLVSSPSGPGGAICPDPDSNIVDCVNCVFSPWNPDGELAAVACNQTTGKKTQSRTITVPASGGGTCTEPTTREEACTVNCQIGTTSAWTACANGTKTRTAPVNFTPKNGGLACDVVFNNANPAPNAATICTDTSCTQTQQCATCMMSDWGPFGSCSTNCGTGTQTRTRTVQTQPLNEPACPTDLTNDQACTNNDGCVVNAVCGWSEWSACDNVCNGNRRRTRTTITPSRNGGGVCDGTETERCNVNASACGSQATGDTMNQYQYLAPGTSLKSRDGRFQLNYQPDGSFGYYDLNYSTSGWKWGYGNYGETPGKAELTPEGVLRVLDSSGRVRAQWGDANAGSGAPYKLIMQCDGNLVIYDTAGRATWASNQWLVPNNNCDYPWSSQPPPAVAQKTAAVAAILRPLFGTGGSGGGGSDIRLKSNIRKTGNKIAGLDEYTWTWNDTAIAIGVGSDPTIGVIAQEAIIMHPDVVFTGPHGYLMVNYRRLRAIKE